MEKAYSSRNKYTYTQKRIIFTENEMQIPGVRIFAHQILSDAAESLEWHYHEDAFEFSVPVKGTFSFSTEGKEYPFSGGDVFVSFPDEVHGTDRVPITVGELYWFQLDVGHEEDILFLREEAARMLIRRLKALPHHVIKTDLSRTLPVIKNAFELVKKQGDKYQIASFLCFFLNLILIYSEKDPSGMSDDIKKAVDHICTHLTDELLLEDLAGTASLSRSQFQQKFKRQMGVAPKHFINQKKIEYSKKLLLEGRSVTETAMTLNFGSSSYFAAVFRKYTLCAPGEFVRKQKEVEDSE